MKQYYEHYRQQAAEFNRLPEERRVAGDMVESLAKNEGSADVSGGIRRGLPGSVADGVPAEFRDRSATTLVGKTVSALSLNRSNEIRPTGTSQQSS